MVRPPAPESKTPMDASAVRVGSARSRSKLDALRSASRAGSTASAAPSKFHCVILLTHVSTLFDTTKFTLLAEDAAHGVADLAQRRVCLNGVDNQWDEIVCAARAVFQGGEPLLDALVVAALAQGCQLRRLPPTNFGVDAQQGRTLLLFLRETIDAHDDGFLFFQRLLILIRRL